MKLKESQPHYLDNVNPNVRLRRIPKLSYKDKSYVRNGVYYLHRRGRVIGIINTKNKLKKRIGISLEKLDEMIFDGREYKGYTVSYKIINQAG